MAPGTLRPNISGNSTVGSEPEPDVALETVYFATAFICGFVTIKLELPPLVGFIAAGFLLNIWGFESTHTIEVLSDVGITLLLFTIGLKVDARLLIQKRILVISLTNLVLASSLFAGMLLLFGLIESIPLFGDLDFKVALIIGFGLSFSSTVFAIKVLEEYGESATPHGRIAVGILVIQDFLAVIFLAATTGQAPNAYALCLLGLPLAQKLLFYLLDHSRHGEIMTLLGLALALVAGYQLFELCGLKGDLGALVMGLLLHSHKKASALSKSLLVLKDVALVSFFLQIGLQASLSMDSFYVALILLALCPFKMLIYFILSTRAGALRARTSLLVTCVLSTYSEFALIVVKSASSQGMLGEDWLPTLAIAVSLTFIAASPLNGYSNDIYVSLKRFLLYFQKDKCITEEKSWKIGNAKVLIVGMGRIGEGVYKTLQNSGNFDGQIVGMDVNTKHIAELLERNEELKMKIIAADACDTDFWRASTFEEVSLIVLAMSKYSQNTFALHQLQKAPFMTSQKWNGKIAARVKYDYEEVELKRDFGVDIVFNSYTWEGTAFGRFLLEASKQTEETPQLVVA